MPSFRKTLLAATLTVVGLPLFASVAHAQTPPVGSGNTAIGLSGWNAGIIDSAANSNVQKFDYANSYSYFANGYLGSYAGLPSDGAVLQEGNSFQLQSYTGNDVLFLSTNAAAQAAYSLSSTGTLSFTSPGSYQTLAILAVSANAAAGSTGTVTLNFSDGSTDNYTYNAYDWYQAGNGQFADVSGNDRVQTNGPATTIGGTFGIDETNLTLSTADAAKTINSMTFASPSGAAETAIFAVSGYNGATTTPGVVNSINIANGAFTAQSGFIVNGNTASTLVSGRNNVNSAFIRQISGTSSILQLTQSDNSEANSAFYANKVNVNGAFNASFTFTKSGGADGMTFILQGNSPYAVGAAGGGLGYTGSFANSVGISLNDYTTAGTSLVTDGTIGTYIAPGASLNTGTQITANLAYDGSSNLIETLTAAGSTTPFFTHTYTGVNVASIVGGNSAYIGFTGATGGVNETQDIYSLAYSFTGAGATPEPGAIALVTVGMVGILGGIRRRHAA